MQMLDSGLTRLLNFFRKKLHVLQVSPSTGVKPIDFLFIFPSHVTIINRVSCIYPTTMLYELGLLVCIIQT